MSTFTSYRKNDVDPSYLKIRGKWFCLHKETDPEAIELLGEVSVECLGYGAYYFPQQYFSEEEWQLLWGHSFGWSREHLYKGLLLHGANNSQFNEDIASICSSSTGWSQQRLNDEFKILPEMQVAISKTQEECRELYCGAKKSVRFAA
ncbi:hypothetical protein [Chamaesiphon sp.]|uniref:hypothetical protein n=1 Tax=Chamaesiphon sp. TaxID=2814140 RepID=UPI0035935E58